MAFTNLRVDNFTITDSLVFTNTNSPSHQDNYAFCQVRINSALFLHYVTDILLWDGKSSNKTIVCFHEKWSVATINFLFSFVKSTLC